MITPGKLPSHKMHLAADILDHGDKIDKLTGAFLRKFAKWTESANDTPSLGGKGLEEALQLAELILENNEPR